MDEALQDRRVIVAAMVWGAGLERSAGQIARRITTGLSARDVLRSVALTVDLDARMLPGKLTGSVHDTSADVTESLRRLERAGPVNRTIGTDAPTRPVTLTEKGRGLVLTIVEPWQKWFEERLGRADSAVPRSRKQQAGSDLSAATAPSHATGSPGRDGRSGGR